MAVQADRGVPLSTLSPKFLHTNSTSHTWPFSAIAELIDNAYDPDVSAKQFWIDKTMVKGEACLSFMDNGNGLDHETMHKMLSFGYSDKIAVNGQEPIGIYGNGFKSGSMRLGKDAIVFSKSKSTSCVGMLSQTYLKEIDAQQIIVPIVCFEEREKNKISVREEHKASLQDILLYSPFNSQDELLAEINVIASVWSKEKTGTRIIIWNLRRTSSGATEFDFETDRYDIRIPSEVYETMNDPSQLPDRSTSYIPETVYSLRAYCSILYLKPRMQVVVRSQKVQTQLIAKSLALIRKDHYKPNFLNKRITITFGYNTKSKDQYGIMMYHKNRLIKAYERVGCQLKADNKGVGVIGVIECNFLDPTHNKQSFNETDKYRKTINNLGIKLEEYWKEMRFRRSKENPNTTIPVEDTKKRPDQNWVQCDDCLRWRKLPDGIDCTKLPPKWFCRMNPDPQFRSCLVEEEPEDSDDDQPSYFKTYKQQEREDKRKQEIMRQKAEEDQRRQEEQRAANLAKQRQIHSRTVHSPSAPTTPRSRTLQGGAARAESSMLSSSTISQAACSPSSTSGLPVITSVCSLSQILGGKRPGSVTPQSTPKMRRIDLNHGSTSDILSSVDVIPLRSPSAPVDSGDETDDDIVILEEDSTPKPNPPVLDISKVKKEEDESNDSVSMLEICNDAAMDVGSETNAAGTGPAGSAAAGTSSSSVPPVLVSSATTQTDVPSIKQEVETPSQTNGENGATQSVCNKSGEAHSSNLDASSVEQRVFKQESSEDSQRKQNGDTHHLHSDEDAGPSCVSAYDKRSLPANGLSVTEVQKQQDQLMELMQDAAQERDSLKEKVQRLTSELEAVQSRLQEASHSNIKKECSHQASQTEVTEREKDYKSLFEKAKQKVNELIKDKEALIAATETKPNHSTGQGEEGDVDEIALQVDSLIRRLDQSNKENNDLRSQLNRLEEEKANLAAQCEELKSSLQQERENAPPARNSDSSDQTRPEEAGELTDSDAHSSSDAFRSLLELRQNVGRLLITYVPALDLEQVNFRCNVIDEILEQVLASRDSVTGEGLSDDAINE
ncbi:MORC family CW-type zinc finger protein 3a [Acanthochromis polyacanthus]|uniref:MORC family CW-type zinc finger protein 3a n=1 Tax=Acanthochromis polyacanthus TaxID=80966 RepID=UPI000B9043D6|nr:MORC family CW-type zinc finger protein 3a [Acanthochromis polyacanthus]